MFLRPRLEIPSTGLWLPRAYRANPRWRDVARNSARIKYRLGALTCCPAANAGIQVGNQIVGAAIPGFGQFLGPLENLFASLFSGPPPNYQTYMVWTQGPIPRRALGQPSTSCGGACNCCVTHNTDGSYGPNMTTATHQAIDATAQAIDSWIAQVVASGHNFGNSPAFEVVLNAHIGSELWAAPQGSISWPAEQETEINSSIAPNSGSAIVSAVLPWLSGFIVPTTTRVSAVSQFTFSGITCNPPLIPDPSMPAVALPLSTALAPSSSYGSATGGGSFLCSLGTDFNSVAGSLGVPPLALGLGAGLLLLLLL